MPTLELLRMKNIFESMNEKYGLNRTDILILSLCNDGLHGAHLIADTGGLDRGLVSKSMKKLEAGEWITRAQPVKKKRHTEITEKTIEALKYLKEIFEYEKNNDDNNYSFINGL